jgi:RNA recognition motif-containing protein
MVKRSAVRRSSSNSSLQTSALRGPPRKPKQSGHALWVGNLPPGTHILDLKDHFSRDATDDIESVFLISKSNCAFVNYKSEASCVAAMTRFHDSRFQGVRLVCRLRRGSSSTLTQSQTGEESAVIDTTVTAEPEQIDKVKEKFFVVKSLTVEDLERSVVSGIWATQAHNENALNTAYQVSARSLISVVVLTAGRRRRMYTLSSQPTSRASTSATPEWSLQSTARLSLLPNTSHDPRRQSQASEMYP